MTYSLGQAKILLQSIERTPQALLGLVKQISVEASGSFTVFYGGRLPDDTSATAAVGRMLDAGEDIRVIDKTPAGKFLLSTEFLQAAGEASGLSGIDLQRFIAGQLGKNPATDWIYESNVNTGPWAAASKNFADATTGEMRLLVTGSEVDRVFNQVELPALLQNSSVTKIEGYSLEVLKSMHPGAAGIPPDTADVFVGLKYANRRSLVISGFSTVKDGRGELVSVLPGGFIAPDLHELSYLTSHPQGLQAWNDYLQAAPENFSTHKQFSQLHLETWKRLVKDGGAIAIKTAKVLGVKTRLFVYSALEQMGLGDLPSLKGLHG
ncbi:hypothetical protein ACG02S_26200 [Roseateles sp. DC23W]|uniref:Uncharacterized protein n=1 Tax=Pelomonas dachongensis TaxID=3299029 RepID=A0ABW7EV90_9BURK